MLFRLFEKCLKHTNYYSCLLILCVFTLFSLFIAYKQIILDNNSLLAKYGLQPKCKCNKRLSNILPRSELENLIKTLVKRRPIIGSDYTVSYKHTCDMYNVVRRGPGQRVFGFSIYGSNKNYYKYLRHNIEAVKRLHPDWIVRVYHDDTFDKSVVCQFECDEDIVDFCNVSQMPYYNEQSDRIEFYNASYVHAMMWRWFPIGDSFVDYFASRDIDSLIIQREKDAMNEWLSSNTLFHIMRDNIAHRLKILGGMWGYANVRNREFGNQMYKKIIDIDTQANYNGIKNLKQMDQDFLINRVWPSAKSNSTQHDSYYCGENNAKPFPTQRPNDSHCFVACFNPCCDPSLKRSKKKIPECPLECRKQADWKYC